MQRRQLLLSALKGSATFLGLMLLPKQAQAMGGVLPALDQPAPNFNLAGIDKSGAVQRKLADL